jgi:DNA-directed RNA polymerase specialized sigma24 family protein
MDQQQVVLDRLLELKALLVSLVEQKPMKEWLTTAEAGEVLGRAEFTVRQWCRLGRIHCQKKMTGRGRHLAWVISREEITRIQREGILPLEHATY